MASLHGQLAADPFLNHLLCRSETKPNTRAAHRTKTARKRRSIGNDLLTRHAPSAILRQDLFGDFHLIWELQKIGHTSFLGNTVGDSGSVEGAHGRCSLDSFGFLQRPDPASR